MQRVVIVGTGKYLPKRKVDDEEMVRIFAQNGLTQTPGGQPLTAKWIEDIVGIKERRWADDSQNTSDLVLAAADVALKEAGIGWDHVNCLLVGSSSPEAFFPSTACWTLFKTAEQPEIEAADILAACTSGIYALVGVQRALLCEPNYNYGVAIGAEVIATRMTNFTDINSDLWGDGAGAVVLKKANYETESGIICSILGSKPELAPTTNSVGKGTRLSDNCQPNVYLDGRGVQKFVLKILPELIERTLFKANEVLALEDKTAISLEDIALFAVHQANGRIFESPAKKLGIPLEKFYINVDRYANTSSAAVLIVLCEAMEQKIVAKGDLVMLVGFGGGLTWGSVLLRL